MKGKITKDVFLRVGQGGVMRIPRDNHRDDNKVREDSPASLRKDRPADPTRKGMSASRDCF